MSITLRENKRYSVKVVYDPTRDGFISASDAEMDARAIQAVKSAIEKAQICKMPIAKYDVLTKRAYLEYENGARRYVN